MPGDIAKEIDALHEMTTAEDVCKVLYNATQPDDPYDEDSLFCVLHGHGFLMKFSRDLGRLKSDPWDSLKLATQKVARRLD